MKKRSLALFLAILLAFGSVLPVLAVEPDAGLDAGEGEETTLTYEDLYVPGAVFAWNAFDKTAEDTIEFGEAADEEITLAENGDIKLTISKPHSGSVVYGDGYLEVKDTSVNYQGATFKVAGVYAKALENAGDTATYTSSATVALLPYQSTAVINGFKMDYVAFATSNTFMLQTYAMTEQSAFITPDNIALHDAWSQAYAAAKKDASLQEAFRTPIAEEHYNALKALPEYTDHVFTVEVGAEGVAAYSITGFEADYTAFTYLMNANTKIGDNNTNRFYVIDNNSVTNPKLFNNCVAKTVVNTGAWVTDRDWKDSVGTLWTAVDVEETVSQTRIMTAKKTDGGYQYDSNLIVDLVSVLSASKTSTTAPDKAGSNKDMVFGPGLDARYYSVRVYEEALDTVALATNHFAELCEFYKVDLAKLASLNEDARVIAINASAELKLGETDKAAIEAILDDALAAGDGEGEVTVDPYAALYVTDGLMYRWDAYSAVPVFAGEATLADKNGGEVALKLNNTSYDADKKYLVANTNPLNFSALIERDDDGAYVEDEIEFELVMTQNSWNGTEAKDSRPYMAFGPLDNIGSGATHTSEGKDPTTFGGYPSFYYAYRNPAASETETVTYYFDADGNRVEAAVEGGKSVDVTYVKKFGGNVQICTQTWAATCRYFGNPVGESYSVGANMKFNLAADGVGTIDLALIRDRQILPNKSGAPVSFAISYVPGATSQAGVGTKIVPANLAEAEAMAAGNAILNSKYAADTGAFKIGGSKATNMSVAYYAFRLYNRTLTDMERAQNHFADLCAYHQVDLTEFNKLSAENKQALYLAYDVAVINSYDEATNVSFEDVTKEDIETAIHELADESMKPYKALYVAGATTTWNAFQKKEGAAVSDAVLTIAGGEAAYSNGYLRIVGSKLTIAGAYVAPADGETLSYTTEFVYAGYDSGREWTGENTSFETKDAPAYATGAKTTFQLAGAKENLRYVDAGSKALHLAWSTAYAAALNDEALQAEFWTPISKTDYDALLALDDQKANVREVTVGGDGVAAYSLTGYEANWAGFQYVITGLKKTVYYQGFDYVAKGYEGVYNLNVMKNDWNGIPGGWMAQYDYIDNFGPEKGNWTVTNFGEATTHVWVETISTDSTAAKPNAVTLNVYSDGRHVAEKKASGTKAFGTIFSMENFDADIYAIRIYPFALTETQLAQNHFADLANYTLFENIDVFTALKDTSKAALYTEFASARLSDDKAELKAALETAVAKAAVLEKLEGVTAESVLAFDGYQATIWANPAFRAVFSAKAFNVEGATVKASIGVKVGEGEVVYTEVDLTAGKTVIEITPEMTKAAVETEYAFTASVTVEIDGFEFTYDCDMSSDAFGETISVAELYSHAALKDGACAKLVAAAE